MPDFTPRRIVSLQPSATVILHDLGQLDRIVACTKYCADLVPEIAGQATIVSDSWTADAAEIVAMRPDLVIAAVPYQEKAVNEILRSGVRFLGLAPRTLAHIYTDIAVIAGAVGGQERGTAVISRMQEEVESARKRHAGSTQRLPRPRVFCEEWGKPLIASQEWVKELVEAAGGEFVGIPGETISAEEVLQLNPDVLIAAWCGAGERVPLEKIVNQRGWRNMRAAQTRRVFCIRDDYFNTPAPTLVYGLKAIEFALHPEGIDCPQGVRRI